MQKITKSLLIDKSTLIKKIGTVVAEVLQSETTPSIDNTEAKIKTLTDKKQGLIELYLAKDITKAEFQKLKEKYEGDIAIIKQSQIAIVQKTNLQENQEIILKDIQKFITSLVIGEEWNDIFYRNILDTITVAENNALTISLDLLPDKWRAVLKDERVSRTEQTTKQSELEQHQHHFDTSVPISVKSPLTSP